MNTTTTNASLQDYIDASNRKNGLDSLNNARAVLDRAMRDINSNIADYQAADNDDDRAKTLNRTIHLLAASLMSNFRLDQIATYQAALTNDK